VSFTFDDRETEKFVNPGYVTLMHGLMIKSSNFTGGYQCWAPENYSGGIYLGIRYHPMDNFTDAEIVLPDGVPRHAEYRARMTLTIARFNVVSNLVLPRPSGADPVRAEIIVALMINKHI
jgi:hypothetical protein